MIHPGIAFQNDVQMIHLYWFYVSWSPVLRHRCHRTWGSGNDQKTHKGIQVTPKLGVDTGQFPSCCHSGLFANNTLFVATCSLSCLKCPHHCSSSFCPWLLSGERTGFHGTGNGLGNWAAHVWILVMALAWGGQIFYLCEPQFPHL